MSGAAEIYDDDNDDDSDDGFDAGAVYKSSSEILPWIPPPPSSSSSDGDSDRPDHSVTTASTNPSPLKIRESQGNILSAEAQNIES